MLLKNVLTIVGGIALFASCVNQPSATVSTDDSAYDQRKADSLGIPKGNKLSAAMKRAMEWPQRDNSWFFEYKMMPLKGDLAYEEGIVRRDPSAMIKVDNKYIKIGTKIIIRKHQISIMTILKSHHTTNHNINKATVLNKTG